MTGPSTGSLRSNPPASGDGPCRADTTNAARRRSRASRCSTSPSSVSCGASSTKPSSNAALLVLIGSEWFHERSLRCSLGSTAEEPTVCTTLRWRGLDSNF